MKLKDFLFIIFLFLAALGIAIVLIGVALLFNVLTGGALFELIYPSVSILVFGIVLLIISISVLIAELK